MILTQHCHHQRVGGSFVNHQSKEAVLTQRPVATLNCQNWAQENVIMNMKINYLMGSSAAF